MHINLGMIGFGGVNRTFAKIIEDHNRRGNEPKISVLGISDLYLGSIYNSEGIEYSAAAAVPTEAGAFSSIVGGSAQPDNERLITSEEINLVAEASITNPENGEPSLSLCTEAISSGKHVITTNKGPVAFGLRELSEFRQKNGAYFGIEGSVMSGTPVLRWVQNCFPGDTISEIRGILNGTTNFILDKMGAGDSFDDALKTAQKLGYAEADPTADVDGYDVQLKVTILANLMFDAGLSPKDVSCVGISGISAEDVGTALNAGERWKLIGKIRRQPNGNIEAQVNPVKLPMSDPLASISGALNALTVKSKFLGDVTMSGPGAGCIETAYALYSDLLVIANSAKEAAK